MEREMKHLACPQSVVYIQKSLFYLPIVQRMFFVRRKFLPICKFFGERKLDEIFTKEIKLIE